MTPGQHSIAEPKLRYSKYMLYKAYLGQGWYMLTPKSICINFAPFLWLLVNISVLLIVFSIWWEDRKLVPGGWICFPHVIVKLAPLDDLEILQSPVDLSQNVSLTSPVLPDDKYLHDTEVWLRLQEYYVKWCHEQK